MHKYSLIGAGVLALLLSASPLMAANTDNAQPSLIAQAETAATAGNWEAAGKHYQQALAQQPESTLLLSRLAGTLLARQQYANSIPIFQQAISIDQKNAGAFVGLGIAYLHIGRYNASRAAFSEARKLKANKQDVDKLIAWVDHKLAAGEHTLAMPVPHKPEGVTR